MTTMAVFAQAVRTAAAQWGDILYRQVRSARPPACRAKMLLVLAACLAAVTAVPATDTPTTPSTHNATAEILKASETGDSSKVDIVKQIRRHNDDGSYTVGYEAGDGTFKIESRDVLGNVKGTFGYIDNDGEIKRVTYSSSSDPTPVPVTSTTASTPNMIVRMNKTVSSTTRRPLGTVVYPTRSGAGLMSTRSTSTPQPRRRPVPARTTTEETTTEKATTIDEANSNILNLYKAKSEETFKPRSQMLKPAHGDSNDLLTKASSTTKSPMTIKPVYEKINDKIVVDKNKANTIRRELLALNANPHMVSLRQSSGDDSADVYGSHLSLGTVRPLFTTTTPRPKLIPIQSIVAARHKIQQEYQEVPVQEQETNVEASTGRVFDHNNIVTTARVPVVNVQASRDLDEIPYDEPYYRRPATVQFRTNEYLRDNPGAAVPIGNQRPWLSYDLTNKLPEPQYVKEPQQQQQSKESAPEANSVHPYDIRGVTRIIPVHVDERGQPIQAYQPRLATFRPFPATPAAVQPRYESETEMNTIQTPVSTRDLKRLLQILILRQNRLQAIMDQLVPNGASYQALPPLREEPLYDYRYQNARRPFREEDRYDYRYEQPQYRPQPMYRSPVGNYEGGQYESQRYVPRRRLYARPYDAVGAASNQVEDVPEYLPADVREALLLKMLILAISPDFMPAPAPATEMTTMAPTRKQVRNIQILGEEGTTEMKTMPRR